MFNTTMRKVCTGIYTICFKCSTKARKDREAAAAHAAHPTPAQASIKKAQAVLLAASVADKPTPDPVIPPPTQRDLNSISNYVESSYYSLTATTTEDQASHLRSSHPSCSTPVLHFQSPTPSPIFSNPSSFPLPSLSPAPTEQLSMPLMSVPPASAP